MLSALDALERLRAGNARFVAQKPERQAPMGPALVDVDQQPFAVVLGCSDSRVPVELVFDQGMGDLFVIRVAGNIVAPSQIGSVEFAVERFGTPLVIVLGHTLCGAVQATLEELQRPTANQSRNLRSIVDRIRPAVESLLVPELEHDLAALTRHAVRANVRVAANYLRHGSAMLERSIEINRLLVVGAEYSLQTGAVDFFDGLDRGPSGAAE